MLAELRSGLIAVENGCPMKEGIGVMECWSNGVIGIAELHPSYGNSIGALRRRSGRTAMCLISNAKRESVIRRAFSDYQQHRGVELLRSIPRFAFQKSLSWRCRGTFPKLLSPSM